MNEFENKIEKILTQKLKTNYSYEKMILNTLNDIKKNKKTYKIKGIFIRLATVGCAFIIITTSAVFANNIVKNFFNTNEGMDTAISNGYIIEPVMEYINSGDTEMKIDNLLMDDYNLNFTLNIRFDKAIDINNILSIELPNMIIVDNSKKILFCNNQDMFYEYCNKNNLNYSYNEFNENYINSGINFYIKDKNYNENSINLVCNLYGNKYPKSQVLNIILNNINTLDTTKLDETKKSFEGNWNLNIEIPKKFYERTSTLYKVKKCSNPKLNITNVEITDVNMKLELVIQEDKIYQDGDSEEIINEKIKKEIERSMEEQKKKSESGDYDNIGLFYAKPYVETSDGKKYYTTDSTSEDNGYSHDYMTGIIKYWQTFNLTKQQATKNLKVHLKYKNEDILIELEK